MRKFILFFTAILLCFSSFAQNNFGVFIGLNSPSMFIKNSGIDDTKISSQTICYIGGISYIRNINENVEFQSDLRIARKGFYQEIEHIGFLSDTSLGISAIMNYLELPLRINSKIKTGNFIILIGIGGYLGYGISGRISSCWNLPSDDSYYTENIWGKSIIDFDTNPYYDSPKDYLVRSGYTGLHRVDYGLLSSIGVEYKKFRLQFDYTYGLRNLQIEYGQGEMLNHKVYNFTLNYIFNFSNKEKKKAEIIIS